MRENGLVYQRNVSNLRSWADFSVQHVAFALHRITGWALLGWVLVHLGLPAVTSGSSVWNPLVLGEPASTVVVVGLLAVLLFHAFNGLRLLAAELFGVGVSNTRRVFQATLLLSFVLVVLLGVAL